MTDAPPPLGPFGGFDLTQMLRFLQVEGPVHWEVARQVARWVALEGGEDVIGEPEKARLTEVAIAAEARVLAETGLPPVAPDAEALGRGDSAERNLIGMRSVLERLAVTLRHGGAVGPPGPGSPAGVFGALGPLLFGVQSGFMVGQLTRGLLGQHDLLLPLEHPPRPAFVVPNIEAFHAAWSVPADDLRFYIALQEAIRSRLCARSWVAELLIRLARDYVGSFRVDASALESRLEAIDLEDPSSLGRLIQDPEALLGAMQSPEQLPVLERLEATTAILQSYADELVGRLAKPLLGSLAGIREAIRRHRVERSEADKFVQRLLGIGPSHRANDLAASFCVGVTERAGPAPLDRLLEGEQLLPTPAELGAPGLWLARIELVNP